MDNYYRVETISKHLKTHGTHLNTYQVIGMPMIMDIMWVPPVDYNNKRHRSRRSDTQKNEVEVIDQE